MSKVYNNYTNFSTKGLNPQPDRAHNLRQNLSNLYSLNLALYSNERFIGWSDGVQSSDNRYYMKNSGILHEHRGKGLYSLLLGEVLKQTKEEGFLEVYSHHNTDNNTILIAKMKQGFFISGFEILPKYGLTVQLTYTHSEKLKKMFEFRAGKKLDSSINTCLIDG